MDGHTVIRPSAQSSCAGGNAFTCTNQQPYVVNSTLAYGFAGVNCIDVKALCCSCFLLKFKGQLNGKSMVVQTVNSGVGLKFNHFNLAIPGGGVGPNNIGCQNQWNAGENGWGDRYGGVSSIHECAQLPHVLQQGCKFRFKFMEGVSNPDVSFVQVKCPAELVGITGCELPVNVY